MEGQTNQSINLEFLSTSLNATAEKMIEIIDLFIKQIPSDLAIIRKAVNGSDFKTVEIRAHKLKSTLSVVGVISLNDVLSEMQSTAKDAVENKRLKELLFAVEDVCRQAIDELLLEKKKLQIEK